MSWVSWFTSRNASTLSSVRARICSIRLVRSGWRCRAFSKAVNASCASCPKMGAVCWRFFSQAKASLLEANPAMGISRAIVSKPLLRTASLFFLIWLMNLAASSASCLLRVCEEVPSLLRSKAMVRSSPFSRRVASLLVDSATNRFSSASIRSALASVSCWLASSMALPMDFICCPNSKWAPIIAFPTTARHCGSRSSKDWKAGIGVWWV